MNFITGSKFWPHLPRNPFVRYSSSVVFPTNIKVLHELLNTLHAVEHPRTASDAVGTTAGALQLDR